MCCLSHSGYKFTRCLSYRGKYDDKIERTNPRYRGLLPPTNRGDTVPRCWDLSMSSRYGGFSLYGSHLTNVHCI